MVNDYSAIGFRIEDKTDFAVLHAAHPELCTRRITGCGEAVERFSPDGRAELWYYADEDGSFGDYAEPGYRSGRSTPVVPQEWRPGGTLEVETAVCPLTVAVPGASPAPVRMGTPCSMELTLFARDLAVYDDADAYMEKQRGRMAPESIIPFGSFRLSGNEDEFEPEPEAEVNGLVTEVTLRENPVHHGQYYEIGLSCLGIDFTVAADTALLPVPPQIGNILSGIFWVSGRFPD